MITRVVLYFFVFTCLSSMSAMDASATLLAIVMLVNAVKWYRNKEEFRLFNWTGFDWVFPVWILVVWLGFLSNSTDTHSMALRIVEFKWILIWYAITAAIIYVKPTPKILPWVSLLIFLSCSFAIALSFIGYDPIKGAPIADLEGSFLGRTGGLYGNPMTLAHCYGVFFCMISGGIFYWKKWTSKEQIWISICVSFLGATLLLTFTRGVWISAFFAIVAMGYLYRKKLAAVLTGSGIAVFALAFMFWTAFRLRMIYAFGPGSSDQLRTNLWKANIEIFKDHFWFGAGYGENTKILPEYFNRLGITEMTLFSHAHNQIIHFLAGTGIIGALIFLLFNFFFLRLNLRVFNSIDQNINHWHKAIALGAFGAQIHFLAGGLFESNFEHAKMKYVMMLAWGAVVWLAYEHGVLKRKAS